MKNVSMIMSIVFFVFSLFLVFLSIQAKKHDKLTTLFGYSYSVVVTSSMKPDIEAGEIIVIKKLNYQEYLTRAEVGKDNLVYFSYQYNRFIVHQLYDITEEGLILKGTNNPSADSEVVTENNFHGIVVSQGGKKIGTFLLSSKSLMLFVFIVFLVFVVGSESAALFYKRNKNKSSLDEETKQKLIKEIKEELKRGENRD